MFDFAAVHLIGEKVGNVDIRINYTFTDVGDDWTMWIRNGALNARRGHVDVSLAVSGPKAALAMRVLHPGDAAEYLTIAGVTTTGDIGVFQTLAPLFDTFNSTFNLATP